MHSLVTFLECHTQMTNRIELDIDLRNCPAEWQNFVQSQRTSMPEVNEVEFADLCTQYLLNEYDATVIEIPLSQLRMGKDNVSCLGGYVEFSNDEKYELFLSRCA